MGDEKHDQTDAQDEAHHLDETELDQDLEIKDAEDANAVKGGAQIKFGDETT